MRFYVNTNTKTYGTNLDDFSPRVANSFILKHTAWDDYSVQCEFLLFYCDRACQIHEIGRVKIISTNTEKALSSRDFHTIIRTCDELQESFERLPSYFCSLGQYGDYYEQLKLHFPIRYEEVLSALRDCATNAKILEIFSLECPLSFRRLARRDIAQEALHTANALLQGINLSEIHKFSYLYKPPYGSELSKISFNFDNKNKGKHNHADFSQRIYTIIGKNGAGKTGLLNNIAKELSNENREHFLPNIPIFQKVMYISSSCFDNEPNVEKNDRYNYVYSGISNNDQSSIREFIQKKIETCYNLINGSERETTLLVSLTMLLPEQLLEKFINNWKINLSNLNESLKYLSSGECIQILHIFSIVAHIFSGTLLLFDEPETHLHPNAITRLISTLIYILEEYNSYAIISTHSPLIVQNFRAKEVILAERYGDVCRFEPLAFETLGNNLSSITDKIFHNDILTSAYIEKIHYLKLAGESKENLISKITATPNEMSLALSLYIDMIYRE